MKKVLFLGFMLLMSILLIAGCNGEEEEGIDFSQLDGKTFAVPSGTVADELVLSKFPNAEFKYYDNALDCCMAVKSGEVDAAAYDEPILKNIAAKNPGLKVLAEMITQDDYGFAVQLTDEELKKVIDEVVSELKADGTYEDMVSRWLPEIGNPAPMPEIELTGTKGTLKYGTAAITEPFSFIDESQKIVGFDIELAMYVAQKLEMDLEIMDLDFGELIPELMSGKVDMIGACITITEERAQSVLFSEPYYVGGIAALVRE